MKKYNLKYMEKFKMEITGKFDQNFTGQLVYVPFSKLSQLSIPDEESN